MCDCCRRLKAALWTARAEAEVTTGPRNWFGTLTLSPAMHYQIVTRCRVRLRSGGTDFDSLSESEQFAERMTEIGREVTLWLKRIRKESGATLKYLLVAEAHKSGLPHLHVLMHEQEGSVPVRYRTLSTQWKLGFSKFNLVDGKKAARYVCKYISKDAMARVRASLRYGQQAASTAQERGKAEWVEKDVPEKGDVKKSEHDIAARARLLPQVSLTDHSGGQKHHGSPCQDFKSTSRFEKRRLEPTKADEDRNGFSSSDTVSSNGPRRSAEGIRRPPEAAIPACERAADTIYRSADTAIRSEATPRTGVADRTPYSGPPDPDVPF